MNKLLLPAWLLLDILFPLGQWLCGLVAAVYTDIAHAPSWSIRRYVLVGLLIIFTIVVVQK